MAQPVWVTDPGSLGTVEEGKFFQIPLSAFDPDYPNDTSKISYLLISGELPQGVRVGASGLIEGIPQAFGSVAGVPAEVGENVTSRFTVRVYNDLNRVNDRTFSITVVGQDIPTFTTPPGQIGAYYDGDFVNYQIEFIDDDPNDEVEISITNGELPPGLTLSSTGLISGYIDPIAELEENAIAGWDRDGSAFDEFPYDFSSRSINKNYEFVLKLSDGKQSELRAFSIFVYSRDSMTADTTDISVDNSFITTDVTSSRNPYIDNYASNLGTYTHDNFYAHQFVGVDPDGDRVRFVFLGGTLPPGLHLDEVTGWMLGYIPDIGIQNLTYNFTIRIAKQIDASAYRDYGFSITITGSVGQEVTWITDSDLGTIINGNISTLSVSAVHVDNIRLKYRIKSGSNSKLPQGLKLESSGNIIGRVSFETFSLDGGDTTFDKDLRTRLSIDETTFDMVYEFTIEAYNDEEIVNIGKIFTVNVVKQFKKPCQCLRIEALPPINDRAVINQLVNNQDIFKPEWIYRADDLYFGVQKKVRYEHAYAMNPAYVADYVDAMVTHHYRKKLILGEVKTARALDDNDNVLYEVVYSQIIDDQVNKQGESVSRNVRLKYPINAGDSTEINTVYPNSLENMRNIVIDSIGQISDVLPRWMLSKQEDGSILGFVAAWIIAYTMPGRAKQIAYNITEQFGNELNKIDFIADRYTLDGSVSQNWDIDAQRWKTSSLTTFDRENINDQLVITSDTDIYRADDNIWPTADHAASDASAETIFDGNSTRFITSINIHEYTDRYDKYILFPQRRIIEHGE